MIHKAVTGVARSHKQHSLEYVCNIFVVPYDLCMCGEELCELSQIMNCFRTCQVNLCCSIFFWGVGMLFYNHDSGVQ